MNKVVKILCILGILMNCYARDFSEQDEQNAKKEFAASMDKSEKNTTKENLFELLTLHGKVLGIIVNRNSKIQNWSEEMIKRKREKVIYSCKDLKDETGRILINYVDLYELTDFAEKAPILCINKYDEMVSK